MNIEDVRVSFPDDAAIEDAAIDLNKKQVEIMTRLEYLSRQLTELSDPHRQKTIYEN